MDINIAGVPQAVNYRLLITTFVLITVTYSGWAQTATLAATKDGAAKFVANLSSQALKTLSTDGVSLDQKEKKVRVLLAKNFDLNLIGRYVLGAAWRKASADQRSQYQTLFKEFVLRTYSRRFGGYAGQAFTITGAKPIGKKDILVTTKIARPSGPPVLAGWRVREKNGHHKILDVVVAGVSMVVTQRSEFRAVVRKQGVGGLIETLRMQVTKFSAQSK